MGKAWKSARSETHRCAVTRLVAWICSIRKGIKKTIVRTCNEHSERNKKSIVASDPHAVVSVVIRCLENNIQLSAKLMPGYTKVGHRADCKVFYECLISNLENNREYFTRNHMYKIESYVQGLVQQNREDHDSIAHAINDLFVQSVRNQNTLHYMMKIMEQNGLTVPDSADSLLGDPMPAVDDTRVETAREHRRKEHSGKRADALLVGFRLVGSAMTPYEIAFRARTKPSDSEKEL